eukprot:gene140-6053_t
MDLPPSIATRAAHRCVSHPPRDAGFVGLGKGDTREWTLRPEPIPRPGQCFLRRGQLLLRPGQRFLRPGQCSSGAAAASGGPGVGAAGGAPAAGSTPPTAACNVWSEAGWVTRLQAALLQIAADVASEPGDRAPAAAAIFARGGDAPDLCKFAGCEAIPTVAPAKNHALRTLAADGSTARKPVSLSELLQGLPPPDMVGDVLVVAPRQHVEQEGRGDPVPLTYALELPDSCRVCIKPRGPTAAQGPEDGAAFEVVAMLEHARPRRRYVDVHARPAVERNPLTEQWRWSGGSGHSRLFERRSTGWHALPVEASELPPQPSLLVLKRCSGTVSDPAATPAAAAARACDPLADLAHWMHELEAMSPVLLDPAALLQYLRDGGDASAGIQRLNVAERAALLWVVLFGIT